MEAEIKDFVARLITFLVGPGGKVEVGSSLMDDFNEIDIKIYSSQAAPLIGRGGTTIEAIRQMVLLKALSLKNEKSVRVRLDINDYYKSQDDNLIKKVNALTKTVLQTKEPVRLERLTPRQRRLVHLYCQEQSDQIMTYSEDTSRGRVLVIAPARTAQGQ